MWCFKRCPWETDSVSASQIPHLLWNLKIHYYAHKYLWPVPILIQINPVHTLPSVPSSSMWSGFLIKIFYEFLISPLCAVYSNHLILLDSFTLIMFGEKQKWWSCLLCSFLQYPDISSLLGPNISLAPCSQTCVLPLM